MQIGVYFRRRLSGPVVLQGDFIGILYCPSIISYSMEWPDELPKQVSNLLHINKNA